MDATGRGTLDRPPMTRSSKRKTSAKPPAPRPVQQAAPDVDVDPTERFKRAEDGIALEEALIVTVPPEVEPSDLALTQNLPKAGIDEFDEDLIRTHEMPMAGEDWLQEMLDSGERSETRARSGSRSGKETTGLFPHPASGTRTAATPNRSRSQTAAVRTPLDAEAGIRTAYRQYFAMCQKHAQAVVGEDAFAKRLRERLAKLEERYPRDKIEFRPVVDNGVVRVRVLLARSAKQ